MRVTSRVLSGYPPDDSSARTVHDHHHPSKGNGPANHIETVGHEAVNLPPPHQGQHDEDSAVGPIDPCQRSRAEVSRQHAIGKGCQPGIRYTFVKWETTAILELATAGVIGYY